MGVVPPQPWWINRTWPTSDYRLFGSIYATRSRGCASYEEHDCTNGSTLGTSRRSVDAEFDFCQTDGGKGHSFRADRRFRWKLEIETWKLIRNEESTLRSAVETAAAGWIDWRQVFPAKSARSSAACPMDGGTVTVLS